MIHVSGFQITVVKDKRRGWVRRWSVLIEGDPWRGPSGKLRQFKSSLSAKIAALREFAGTVTIKD